MKLTSQISQICKKQKSDTLPLLVLGACRWRRPALVSLLEPPPKSSSSNRTAQVEKRAFRDLPLGSAPSPPPSSLSLKDRMSSLMFWPMASQNADNRPSPLVPACASSRARPNIAANTQFGAPDKNLRRHPLARNLTFLYQSSRAIGVRPSCRCLHDMETPPRHLTAPSTPEGAA